MGVWLRLRIGGEREKRASRLRRKAERLRIGKVFIYYFLMCSLSLSSLHREFLLHAQVVFIQYDVAVIEFIVKIKYCYRL